MVTTIPGSDERTARSRWVALALLAGAQLMLVLDVTVVNVALPEIGLGLHLTRAVLPWAMTTYTVFFGGLMLLGGRIADLIGPRRVTLAGLAAFTQALAEEVAKDGILVNAVAPSIMDTPANRHAMPKADHAAWPKVEEVAATIVFLASPANAVTRGAIVPVYGKS